MARHNARNIMEHEELIPVPEVIEIPFEELEYFLSDHIPFHYEDAE